MKFIFQMLYNINLLKKFFFLTKYNNTQKKTLINISKNS